MKELYSMLSKRVSIRKSRIDNPFKTDDYDNIKTIIGLPVLPFSIFPSTIGSLLSILTHSHSYIYYRYTLQQNDF